MTNAVNSTDSESLAARLICHPPPVDPTGASHGPGADLTEEERIAVNAAFRDCVDKLRSDPATIGRFGPREQAAIGLKAAREALLTMRAAVLNTPEFLP